MQTLYRVAIDGYNSFNPDEPANLGSIGRRTTTNLADVAAFLQTYGSTWGVKVAADEAQLQQMLKPNAAGLGYARAVVERGGGEYHEIVITATQADEVILVHKPTPSGTMPITDDPAADYTAWLQTLNQTDFCDEYDSVRSTWNSGQHNWQHDTEMKMDACLAEEKRRDIQVPIIW